MKRIGENAGFVKLHRELAASEFWLSERFTKAQAWVDLLMLAQGVDNVQWEGGKLYNFKGGTVYISIEALAERWKWNRKTVSAFLKRMAEEGRATTVSRKMSGTQITIENWGHYQNNPKLGKTMDMQLDIVSPWPGHGGMDTDEDRENRYESYDSDDPEECPLDEEDANLSPNELGHNKEEIKNYKEYIMSTSEGSPPPPPTPLLKRGGVDGSSVKTKADIPEMWRNDFDTYEDYWRWRNQ